MKTHFIPCLICLTLALGVMSCKKDPIPVPPEDAADLVVFGKIFTSDDDGIVHAFAVKDGKYIYVGDKSGAKAFIAKGKTEVIDYTDKGLVMPSCGDGHAHYMMGYGFKSVGTNVGQNDTPQDFLERILPSAIEKAKTTKCPVIFGFGWNYHAFSNNMPTRQQIDEICEKLGYNVPVYFADNEGHKGLVNTKCLVAAGIMKEDGTVLKKSDDIRGGEIVMGTDGKPTGFLKEQAGTYVRSKLDNNAIYTVDIAEKDLVAIQNHLLSRGYTMYMDGWSNYFFNDNFYKAIKRADSRPDGLNVVIGLSHEIESWSNVSEEIKVAKDMMSYAGKHIKSQWIKLFIDGTVEGGTGYVDPLYPATLLNPEPHQGLVNWSESEVADITRQANASGLTMHIHTMGNKAVNLCVGAFSDGGKDEMRNTLVHVRNVMPSDWERMSLHNIYGVSGMIWHHLPFFAPTIMWLMGMVPEGMEDKAYPMRSYFNYGLNIASHTDFPALSGSPDDPFGIMQIAVTGVINEEEDVPWWSEELLTREQALTALTINVARQMFMEDERGSITEGKYADFILVDKDVLSCPLKDIHNAKTNATYFEGKQVYSLK